MYKLVLRQVGTVWEWYVLPYESIFSADYATYSGKAKTIRAAIRAARKSGVDPAKLGYTYMDRHAAKE